ncbi:hypothetical protein [Streptomyces sp. NPDC050485]|uniref:hypothetical protein n=1 Tax=Streptomyces sp. NPDC050485 TaxID=3365617 RepID=UPI0037A5C2F6
MHITIPARELRRGDAVPASPYASRWVNTVTSDGEFLYIHWLATGTYTKATPNQPMTVLSRDNLSPLPGPDTP